MAFACTNPPPHAGGMLPAAPIKSDSMTTEHGSVMSDTMYASAHGNVDSSTPTSAPMVPASGRPQPTAQSAPAPAAELSPAAPAPAPDPAGTYHPKGADNGTTELDAAAPGPVTTMTSIKQVQAGSSRAGCLYWVTKVQPTNYDMVGVG